MYNLMVDIEVQKVLPSKYGLSLGQDESIWLDLGPSRYFQGLDICADLAEIICLCFPVL